MQYNLFCPWLSLDPWQKEYIETLPEQDCFLLNGRQTGKTTAMSIKSVELCVKHFKEGENVLIASLTEKQGYLMLAKSIAYAQAKYPKLIAKGADKPTMHKLTFTNGTKIFCYAAGETGEGLRGYTIKKLMVDEGSRMRREFFIAVLPMLSVINGSMDIASTPFGKFDRDGKETFFYQCSKDEHYKKFYVSAEDCPRHDKEFLDNQKIILGKFFYAQEYLAMFLDEMRRLFTEETIKELCVLKRREKIINGKYYCGSDIAGFGGDLCTYEIFDKISKDNIEQVENICERRQLTTETSKRIILLNNVYDFRKIGVDDGGVGFGVYSELMSDNKTKRKTEALNNASRKTNRDGTKSKKLLKEDMYFNALSLMENKKVKFLDDEELKNSLSSMQCDEEGKIYGSDAHISEGIVRGLWLCSEDKSLKLYIY